MSASSRNARALPVDVRAALKEATGRMRDAGVPSHALAAELLLIHTLGRDRAWLYTYPEAPLEPAAAEQYFSLVARRAAGEPTQYLTGKQEFWGLEFEVNPSVLIPRPETEHIVEVALERLGPKKSRGLLHPLPSGTSLRPAPSEAGLRIADVCTGSGCLAVALARELPEAEVWATDISAEALGVAQRNAARHGVAGRVQFIQCNLLDALFDESRIRNHESRILDVVVSNPPYVGRSEAAQLPREVRYHEPEQALFAGESGVEIYAPLIRQAQELLCAGGILVLELGYNALDHVHSLLRAEGGWHGAQVTDDLAGIPRVISAERV